MNRFIGEAFWIVYALFRWSWEDRRLETVAFLLAIFGGIVLLILIGLQ